LATESRHGARLGVRGATQSSSERARAAPEHGESPRWWIQYQRLGLGPRAPQ
jgi:hypothetical protein